MKTTTHRTTPKLTIFLIVVCLAALAALAALATAAQIVKWTQLLFSTALLTLLAMTVKRINTMTNDIEFGFKKVLSWIVLFIIAWTVIVFNVYLFGAILIDLFLFVTGLF